MHQEFVARIEGGGKSWPPDARTKKTGVGWLKVADNYRKQLDRLEPPAEQAEDAKPVPAPSRSRHAA